MSAWSAGVAATGVGLFLLLVAIRWVLAPTGRHRAPAPATGPVQTGYRYCPDELRTRAAVLHADGTARCTDCGAHIPAGDS